MSTLTRTLTRGVAGLGVAGGRRVWPGRILHRRIDAVQAANLDRVFRQ